MTSVDISAMNADLCMKYYGTVKAIQCTLCYRILLNDVLFPSKEGHVIEKMLNQSTTGVAVRGVL